MYELYYEPRQSLEDAGAFFIDNEPEMDVFESAFVCGIIKEKKPKRILEIGVALGGTTAIIIQCVNELKLTDCEIVSVDLNKRFYRNDVYETGYLAKELKKKISVNHKFLLGKTLAEYMDELGNDFDVVILDTVHSMAGEMLDMPLILQLISSNGTIIIHDVGYHCYNIANGFSNILAFSICIGNRILPIGLDKSKSTPMPNIGAINITGDTVKYVASMFYAMMLPWTYLPSDKEIELYRRAYSKYYTEELVNIFDTAVELNKSIAKKSKCLKNKIKRCGKMFLENEPY